MSAQFETYAAFMLDHTTGRQSHALALAGDLHVLLSDEGASIHDIWTLAAGELSAVKLNDEARQRVDKACSMLAGGFDGIEWRRGLSGAHYSRRKIAGGKLMRLLPGKSVPRHGHRKLEVTVVLEGQLADGNGKVYDKGDILFGVPGVRHKPSAHGQAPCICYVAKA